MLKGENIVSIALAAVVLLAVIAVQRRWNPASLEDVASSAENFILTTTGIRGEVPDIAGYERLRTFTLGDNYRAAFYRATPAPLVFAPGRFVIYDQSDHPAYRLDTLEGSKESWSAFYDFTGRHGLTIPGSRARPSYTRDLTGDSIPDVIVAQFSGGSNCCTQAAILELGKDAVKPIGRIEGIDGLPFEGFELRRPSKGASWQFIVHRPFTTSCGTSATAGEVLSVYAFTGDSFQDQTLKFGDYLEEALRQDLGKWRQERNHNLSLLQTIAMDFAAVGQKDAGKRFFALNLSPFMPSLQSQNLDPNQCIDSLESAIDRLPSAEP